MHGGGISWGAVDKARQEVREVDLDAHAALFERLANGAHLQALARVHAGSNRISDRPPCEAQQVTRRLAARTPDPLTPERGGSARPCGGTPLRARGVSAACGRTRTKSEASQLGGARRNRLCVGRSMRVVEMPLTRRSHNGGAAVGTHHEVTDGLDAQRTLLNVSYRKRTSCTLTFFLL